MSDRIVRYIDKGAVAYAQAQEHQRRRIDWVNLISWITMLCGVVAFWWWALLC